ncbi:phosphatidylglycerol lysyltransferase domain-containing protein [Nocardioides mangrovicus]|uniref:phosphatidylglycerol lysyltransferase domain-containing protein n=1 Tax=Nocardioides mangrovicus TaxID=2478913 RepID=UPI001314E47C|nr:phosphatidylglycerol lysyltransferase domain-containing protein [Nocardioides mangrovicus]
MWKALTSPAWLARIVGVVGLISFLSALLPAIRGRLDLVLDVLPAVFPAAADTGTLALGILLMVLSRALRRGKHRAWVLAVVLTAATVALHLVKGLDVEEATISLLLLVLLIAGRRHFTARPDPRSPRKVLSVVVLGPIIATALGWAWLAVDARGEEPGTTTWQRLQHAFLGLAGIRGPVQFVSDASDDRASVALVVLGASILIPLAVVALQPADGPHPLDAEQQRAVREILARWGKVDSLSYFATRGDRSVLFSKSGKAAVSYRVMGTVSLAAGDPLGDPEAWPGAIEAWLEEAQSYGWVPAVLGASDQAATAYHRAGLDALELGDEAILDVEEFSLEGRSMRVVRQAVSRCTRADLAVECHRATDLDEATWAELRRLADAWRDGPVERGFSMALDRFGDPGDDRSVVVVARDAAGRPQGLLNFAPWGDDGLSLDLMRRERDSENGLIEHMVVALLARCPELGVRRISLNFAVFRSVFARGERLGAGPVQRLTHAVLLWASRFWQIESLYRANAKYHPEWVPRYLCFRTSGDLARVGVAALRAEAFIVAPTWIQKIGPS